MAALLILGLFLARAAPAAAHAFLDHADPRVGSTVAAAPPALTLVFTEPVEPTFSRVALTRGDGTAVATGEIVHPAPATLRVALPPLAPGTYTVSWAVVSIDTHPTEGRFTFTVRGP
jgi:methionine-rich copper-binding protein CopC